MEIEREKAKERERERASVCEEKRESATPKETEKERDSSDSCNPKQVLLSVIQFYSVPLYVNQTVVVYTMIRKKKLPERFLFIQPYINFNTG